MSTADAIVVDPHQGSHGTMKIEKTEKRDLLQATEKKYQKLWQDEKVFEVDAPTTAEHPSGLSPDELRAKFPKYFCICPNSLSENSADVKKVPWHTRRYVNGTAHLGHAFTLSKVEFVSRVARAEGKRTLYPQGYHGTGMPIKACADKLVYEMKMFGKNFEGHEETDNFDEVPIPAPVQELTKEDVTKFTNVTKGKVALKSVKTKYQFQVMLALGIPRADIHKFAEAQYWLHFFPQLWQQHLTEFGCAIDWRRSFITTDVNPYYDSFVQWQMRRLKQLGKIQFGKRHTIYSPKDGQPCLGHDRSVGETVSVQEYTGLKCKVKKWSEQAQHALSGKLLGDANVYMVSATLRPETVYGQSNLFVSPTITYGIFHVLDNDYFFITDRAARNMAFQGIFPKSGTFTKVAEVKGCDVIGTVVAAPMSRQGDVYILPMETIKETKGTGVVASVPSDSPDDYAMTVELSKKAAFYKINPEWVSLDILPIIEAPGIGNLIAPSLVKEMKISSPKDVEQLAKAKERAYKLGFYEGRMIYGDFTGKPVQEAKYLVRQSLMDSGDAIVYCEPDGLAISRSGDECVVAYLDQWFLAYGNADNAWREDVLSHIRGEDGQGFNSFNNSTKNSIEQTLGWLNQWSVTRQYGLGTKLPWDTSELVEGLSDSTIYMAYYTIAHYLHSDIYGAQPGIGNVKVSQMTDEVWDYIFAIRNEVKSDILQDTLEAMRREFTYWYPLDVRISGKDLINNHLMFFLYVHQALWGKVAPQYLPKSIRLNGHVTLNNEKMSKSTGNFLTLDAAIKKFGADATRIALADGGDSVEDANFEETVANANILKLFELRKWIEEVIIEARLLKDGENYKDKSESEKPKNVDVIQRTGTKIFWDDLFENELNMLVQETIQQYKATNFKAVLKSGFYDFTATRDSYRLSTTSASLGMHHGCVRRYIELQALMICIIAPHWADYIWRDVLKKPSTIQNITFPQVAEPDLSLNTILNYVRSTSSAISAADGAQQKRLAKGKDIRYDPKQAKQLTIFVAKSWPAWQARYIELVRQKLKGITLDIKDVSKDINKAEMKKAMPFIHYLKRKLESGESKDAVLDRDLGFDEVQVLGEMVTVLKATVVKLKEVNIVIVEEGAKAGLRVEDQRRIEGLPQMAASAEPGSPSFEFTNL